MKLILFFLCSLFSCIQAIPPLKAFTTGASSATKQTLNWFKTLNPVDHVQTGLKKFERVKQNVVGTKLERQKLLKVGERSDSPEPIPEPAKKWMFDFKKHNMGDLLNGKGILKPETIRRFLTLEQRNEFKIKYQSQLDRMEKVLKMYEERNFRPSRIGLSRKQIKTYLSTVVHDYEWMIAFKKADMDDLLNDLKILSSTPKQAEKLKLKQAEKVKLSEEIRDLEEKWRRPLHLYMGWQ
jgi:hypothetical protein